jgi:hypothetical protein
MPSFFCLSCLADAVLSIAAAIAAVFALRSFTRAAVTPERISAVLMARLGSCRPCILASVLLLAVSLAALFVSLRFAAPLPVLIFFSLATGLLLSLAIAHLFMYLLKKNAPPPPAPSVAPLTPTIPTVPRKCCGQK